jgi:hypothetical protein
MKKALVLLAIFLSLSACINIEGITKGAEFKVTDRVEPSSEDAVINFFHTLGLENVPVPLSVGPPGANVPIFFTTNNLYQIWDSNGFVGFLPATSRCIQVRVKPGRQVFLGRFVRENAGNWTVLEGDVAAGKSYFVKVSQRWNTWKPSVSFEAQTPSDDTTNGGSNCAAPLAYDRTSPGSAEFLDRHVSENQEEVRVIFEKLKSGSKDFYFDSVLKLENGR